ADVRGKVDERGRAGDRAAVEVRRAAEDGQPGLRGQGPSLHGEDVVDLDVLANGQRPARHHQVVVIQNAPDRRGPLRIADGHVARDVYHDIVGRVRHAVG